MIPLHLNLEVRVLAVVVSQFWLLLLLHRRVIGVDADHTDLFFFNPWLFFELKKFDLIHTTAQLYCMSNTAR